MSAMKKNSSVIYDAANRRETFHPLLRLHLPSSVTHPALSMEDWVSLPYPATDRSRRGSGYDEKDAAIDAEIQARRGVTRCLDVLL